MWDPLLSLGIYSYTTRRATLVSSCYVSQGMGDRKVSNSKRDLLTTPLSGLAFATIHLHTKFELCIAHYEDMKGVTNIENGVVWGS